VPEQEQRLEVVQMQYVDDLGLMQGVQAPPLLEEYCGNPVVDAGKDYVELSSVDNTAAVMDVRGVVERAADVPVDWVLDCESK
jgi:hypothetical protein